MFILLPAAFFFFLFYYFQAFFSAHSRYPNTHHAVGTADWRHPFLDAAVVWGIILAGMTEFLSFFHALTFRWVLTGWLVTLGGSFYLLLKQGDFARYWNLHCRGSRSEAVPAFRLILLAGIVLIIALVGVIALVAPPNTVDSMTYHMTCVMHWIQNRSVAFYPTPRQHNLNPWAEFAILHFQVLSLGDRFANLVQFLSLIGSLVGVTVIAKHFQIGPEGQIFAAVIASTIPMGILQGSTTQNDWAVCFWLVCFVIYFLRMKMQPTVWNAALLGASLGLAVLTKATAYIYAFPFLLWFVWWGFSRLGNKFWKLALVGLSLFLALNFANFVRIFRQYGSLIGPAQQRPDGAFKYTNDSFTPPLIFSNVIRNVGLHLGTPLAGWNGAFQDSIDELHRLLGVSSSDPRTSWGGRTFYIRGPTNDEDVDGNPLHLLLIFVSLLLLAVKRLRSNQDLLIFSLALVAAFILFSTYLRWQPWHSRLHLALFVLWSPIIATVILQFQNRLLMKAIVVLLFLSALPIAVFNKYRPLLPQTGAVTRIFGGSPLAPDRTIFNTSRADQYFIRSPQLKDAYAGAVNFINSQQCSVVGISLSWDREYFEYPIWAFVKKNAHRVMRLDYFIPTDETNGKFPGRTNFNPCAIISLSPELTSKILTKVPAYTLNWSKDSVSVLTLSQGKSKHLPALMLP